ncbi:MAG: hypothetical protein HQK88_00650 [Nitrospirae bacterium]|nr:hypothetical protein [Nitrospirota bacterium]MBF0535216.1 hypothetical protein [Nitrospirota bacterium]MBF0615304.1 hypothetical protein [Nitrospirota bacterium]
MRAFDFIARLIAGFLPGSEGLAFPSEFLQREPLKTGFEQVWIEINPAGGGASYRVYAHVHRPLDGVKYPAVVIVPGGGSCGTDYDGSTEVTAEDVASLGFVVLHYDPLGRGKTGGTEDFWGPKHREELSQVVGYLSMLAYVDSKDIGILSFSIGITIATGMLAEFPPKNCMVKYLFDWEGPSNRINITKNDTHKPLKDYPSSNDSFWTEREAIRFIGQIKCGYFRYQAENEHMQGTFKGHAVELLNAATAGMALWSRCNDNPINIIYDANKLNSYHWIPDNLNHKGQILKYLLEIHKY